MKKIIYALCLFACTESTTKAANYYISSTNGDDSRSATQAQNSNTPWKSIDKLNAVFSTLLPGDFILFNRGDEFFGTIKITKSGTSASPITLSSYGSSTKDMPIISGLTKLTNWVSVGNNIWACDYSTSAATINTCLINGIPQPMGRFPNGDLPNKGFLNFESHSGNTQITDKDLSSAIDWTGAELVIKPNRWTLDRNKITGHSGTTLSYVSASGYTPIDNFGYFIQNHLKTLDKQGEWFYDKNAKKMYVHMGTLKPQSFIIQAGGTIEQLITISSQSNIALNNLSITGANADAFKINNAQNIAIKNSKILFAGIDGISSNSSKGVTVENCVINGSNNTALSFGNCTNTIIRNNTIKNSGVMDGMGRSGTSMSEGIRIFGNNNIVEYNTIDSTGYICIQFSGNDVNIKNNFINYYNISKDDGAGIYTYAGKDLQTTWSNRKIIGNIILNGIGAGAGTNSTSSADAEGIYMDDNAGEVDILNNTIANCASRGIYLHNAHGMNVVGNTVYNNKKTQLSIEHDNICPDCLIRKNTFDDNILFAKQTSQLVSNYRSIKDDNDIKNFGLFDNNYYCRPFDDKNVINVRYKNASGQDINLTQDLKTWQTTFSQDLASKKTPFSVPAYSVKSLTGNNLFVNSNFNTTIKGVSAYATLGIASVTWNNTGKLDGGCLNFSYSSAASNTSVMEINVGALTAGKKYVLKTSLLGIKNNKSLRVYLMRKSSPYTIISDLKDLLVTSTRTENEILFAVNKSEADVNIVFEIDETIGTLYLDNVVLQEANVTPNTPDSSIRFEYNATQSSKKVNLGNGIYRDVKNKLYSGDITLAPYTSIVLIKTGETNPSTSQGALSPISDFELNIYPNPSNGKFSIANNNFSNGEKVSIVMYNSVGSAVFSKEVITENQIIIDTENKVAAGVYIVVATINDKSYKKRLVLYQ